jgi:hypothetical protein
MIHSLSFCTKVETIRARGREIGVLAMFRSDSERIEVTGLLQEVHVSVQRYLNEIFQAREYIFIYASTSFRKRYIKEPIIADTGIVRIHAQKIFAVTPHLTADTPFLAPAPIIAPVIV